MISRFAFFILLERVEYIAGMRNLEFAVVPDRAFFRLIDQSVSALTGR
jgi:hypothetical protein